MDLEKTRKEIIDEFMHKIDPTWSDLEKARYIYVNLGRLYSFDLDYQYGNSKRTREILSCAKRLNTKDENQLLNLMQNKYIICISLSKLYLELLQRAGIKNVELISMDDPNDPHIDVKITCGEKSYVFNLQGDLKNIQTGMKTKYFAQNQKVSDTTTISDEELRDIDEKTGYISDERLYTNEYIEALKQSPFLKYDETKNKKGRKGKPDSILKKYLDEMNHRWKELIKTSANMLKLGNVRIKT